MSLYHGTTHVFEPGEIIAPRSKKVAHATRSMDTAQVFGEGGHVYEVEALDPARTWERQMKYTEDEVHFEVLSEEGFRVLALAWTHDGGRIGPGPEDDEYLRECDECGRVTDAGDKPDWVNGVCERCDPTLLDWEDTDG
jgi:hypothetical protein